MRIITGKFKGRKLVKFEADNIRPTSDSVKESVFRVLQYDVEGSVFLDLFGGTGNMGFEAASRGAEKVYIVDNNRSSAKIINENNQKLGANANIIIKDFRLALQDFAAREIKFDIIFIDPPYETNMGQKAIALIKELDLLGEDGVIVFETLRKTRFDIPEFWNVISDRKYGTKRVIYLDFNEDTPKELEEEQQEDLNEEE